MTGDMTGVEKMLEFMNEHKLRWFELVKRMDDERAPVKAKKIVDDGSKKGRPKKMSFFEHITERGIIENTEKGSRKDMLVKSLRKTDAQDCSDGSLAVNTGSILLAWKTCRVPGG